MREHTDLRTIILLEAEKLFAAQGYAATSIKQIGAASGCTSAALYYHFPEGKSQILREVAAATFSQQLTPFLESCRSAATLQEWVQLFGRTVVQSIRDMQQRRTWIHLEMRQLDARDRAVAQQQLLEFHQAISKEIARFVSDEALAGRLAWVLFCAFVGYGQPFLRLGGEDGPRLGADAFVDTLAELFGKAAV